jgi:phage gp46-like protein
MTDIRLKEYFSLEAVTMDFLLTTNGQLDEREELATAARVALGTDRMADVGDILPDPDSTDRRGWWGDFEAAEIWGGWPIGSKNWLLTRAKITDALSQEGSTEGRAQRYTQDALQPLVDRHIASSLAVAATRTDTQTIEVGAQIYRGPLTEIDLRYQLLWQEDPIFDVPKPLASFKIRIPFRSLTLSTTPPLFRVMPPGGNLRITSVAPIVS